MFSFLKRNNTVEPYVESAFESKRGNLTIRGTEYRPEGENLPVAIVCMASWHGRILCASMQKNWPGWVIVPTASISAAAVL